MTTLNIESIVVQSRQRRDNVPIDDKFVDSIRRHLINPVILRLEKESEEEEPKPVLVAGFRRLSALKQLGLTTLEENKHFRFIENLSPIEAKIVELEENAKRLDLPWQDHARAVNEIHNLYTSLFKDWTAESTRKEINLTLAQTNKILTVARNLDSNLLRDARSIEQAYSILQNAAERQTAQIVNNIAAAGQLLFKTAGETKSKTPNGASNGISSSINDGRDVSDSNINSYNGFSTRQDATDSSRDTTFTKATIGESETKNGISNIKDNRFIESIKEHNTILNADFLSWLQTYSGPKFNLIHCDFPYDIKYDSYASSVSSTSDGDYNFTGFWNFLDAFISNLDKFCSYNSHIMFWFSMKFYEKTKKQLESANLFVHEHPFIWFKSDNSGIIPGRGDVYPRRVYETAFLCSRGHRSLVRPLANLYAAPLPSPAIHPSQKSEPMLQHFFKMLIDETTDFLDPTCGSGASVRAAETLGARRVLGIESDPKYAASAEAATKTARLLRKITT